MKIPPTTTMSEMTITTSLPLMNITGSALVTSKLLFNSSSPVPSETKALSVINTLLKSRDSLLYNSVQVLNVTYENISETSYAIIFTFNLINISIPEDPELKNSTYQHLQNVINNVLNTLLNEPGNEVLEAKSSTFTIERVLFYIRVIFITWGPLPSESEVQNLVKSLLIPSLRVDTAQTLSDPVSYVNVTYEKIADNSYALKFGFEIKSLSMAEKLEVRDANYMFIQNSIKRKLNQILSDSDTSIEFNKASFINNSREVIATVDYIFRQQDIKSPSGFLQELLKVMNIPTTPAPTVNNPTQKPVEIPDVIGKVIIYIQLIFITRGPIPSEAKVLELATNLLAVRFRTKRELRAQTLSTPVSFVNVSYTKLSDTSYALDFGFEISNVTMSEKLELRDTTYKLIQDSINKLLNEILNEPTATPFEFKDVNFTGNSTTIQANVHYVFSESDIQKPKPIATTTPAATTTTTTTFYYTVLSTTITNNSTSAAWVVAIIVPCAIAIFLIPCWILLCCLLCGCCTAIRRRWSRRRSYNVQYTTRNSLF
ncbi:uncharacterized protein LOC122348917 [Puntigrus tetrazona]|uniref:uncharacterized protein LOC122348917 n=1 Tax=Puntigrus tetrazona TaxID=1606681 RepID=UPI001C89D13F|nr:uncharacterized protein LOC122348917 [Puntigrus tetrazona]